MYMYMQEQFLTEIAKSIGILAQTSYLLSSWILFKVY